jgi:hypothetical protein
VIEQSKRERVLHPLCEIDDLGVHVAVVREGGKGRLTVAQVDDEEAVRGGARELPEDRRDTADLLSVVITVPLADPTGGGKGNTRRGEHQGELTGSARGASNRETSSGPR